jgi:hypothetical protein
MKFDGHTDQSALVAGLLIAVGSADLAAACTDIKMRTNQTLLWCRSTMGAVLALLV